jgi:poly(3-hydroxybutyrate) depolymerase
MTIKLEDVIQDFKAGPQNLNKAVADLMSLKTETLAQGTRAAREAWAADRIAINQNVNLATFGLKDAGHILDVQQTNYGRGGKEYSLVTSNEDGSREQVRPQFQNWAPQSSSPLTKKETVLDQAIIKTIARSLPPGLPPYKEAPTWPGLASQRDLPEDLRITDPGSPTSKGDRVEKFTLEGRERRLDIHFPKGYDGKSPIPVVYMLPGLGGSIDILKSESGMNNLADETHFADGKQFAVAYLEPLPKDFPGTFGLAKATSWNLDHGSLTPKVEGYDDLNYMKAAIAAVHAQVNVAPGKQYIVGFSEGGAAAAYAAEKLGIFAGVGSVHGSHLDGDDPVPQPGNGAAMIAVHGNDDNMLPLYGGHGWFSQLRPLKGFMSITLPKVSESDPLAQAQEWANANGCEAPEQTSTKHNDTTLWSSCTAAPVKQIIRKSAVYDWGLRGGMHAWDGLGLNGKGDFGWPLVGVPDGTQDTSRDVMGFLLKYSKPEPDHQISPLARRDL